MVEHYAHIYTKGWLPNFHFPFVTFLLKTKLGETNKFYYDEKLKRWTEEGADLLAEEATLLPPPTIAAFSNVLRITT